MRVLLTCRALLGHFQPMQTAAEGLMQAGHDVACASGPSLRGLVEGAGLTFFPAGPEQLSAADRTRVVGETGR